MAGLTDMLSRFGISYPDAPAPTPALLAFMRGIGMSMDTAEDATRTNESRMRERATRATADVNRSNTRALTRMAGDLANRGVLSSGEANIRRGRQAEDVAKAQGDIQQTLAEGIEKNNQALSSTRDTYRQQGLERVLGVETENRQREAVAKAQEDSWNRQTQASEQAYGRQKEAQDAAFRAQEELYKKYAGMA